MCSISWKWNANTTDSTAPLLSIYFNRDEQRNRPLATPPSIHKNHDISYIAPIDPLRGGTWLAVNQYNITVTLLNNYAIPTTKGKKYASRGHIVTSLMKNSNLAKIAENLAELVEQDNYPSFSLLAFDPHKRNYTFFQWDESSLTQGTLPHPFFTSSSWDTYNVQKERLATYLREVVQRNVSNEVFHAHTPKGKELSSVYMQREHTQTVSRTYIHLYKDKVVMDYHDRSQDSMHSQSLATSAYHV